VYANCYFGADHRYNRFQMEFTWITGSVAWYGNVLLQNLLGARAEFGGLRIDPRVPAEWKECEVDREYRGATYRIIIRNPEHLTGVAPTVTLDGEAMEGNLLPIFADGGVHRVEVLYRRAGVGQPVKPVLGVPTIAGENV
jgi:cellobiose phosphorylase